MLRFKIKLVYKLIFSYILFFVFLVGFILIVSFNVKDNLKGNELTLIKFIQGSYQMITFIVIILGIFMGIIVAMSITKPIKKITNDVNEIRKGMPISRTQVRTITVEISELSKSINYLTDTLQHEDLLRKQLITDMAHEIHAPLTLLRNLFEAITDGVWEPNTRYISKCYDEVLRMTDLVERLKDIDTFNETNLVLDNEKINLSSEIESMVDLFRLQFNKKNITVALNIQKSIFVYMDKNKLNQIVINLLSNAHRYTDEGGKVSIELMQDSKHTIFRCKDTGMGISSEDLPYIYERFYRSEKSISKDHDGIGMGLTMAKKMVELYEGIINVESQVGQGTSFEIQFENKKILE